MGVQCPLFADPSGNIPRCRSPIQSVLFASKAVDMSSDLGPLSRGHRLSFVVAASLLYVVAFVLFIAVIGSLFVTLDRMGRDILAIGLFLPAFVGMGYLAYRWFTSLIAGLYRQEYWAAYSELGDPEISHIRYALTGDRDALGPVSHQDVVSHIADDPSCTNLDEAFETSSRFGNIRSGGFLYGP